VSQFGTLQEFYVSLPIAVEEKNVCEPATQAAVPDMSVTAGEGKNSFLGA
jgi:hypothetical protein